MKRIGILFVIVSLLLAAVICNLEEASFSLPEPSVPSAGTVLYNATGSAIFIESNNPDATDCVVNPNQAVQVYADENNSSGYVEGYTVYVNVTVPNRKDCLATLPYSQFTPNQPTQE